MRGFSTSCDISSVWDEGCSSLFVYLWPAGRSAPVLVLHIQLQITVNDDVSLHLLCDTKVTGIWKNRWVSCGSVPWQGVIHVLMGVVWHWVGGRTYSRSLSCSQTTGACMMVRLCLKLAGHTKLWEIRLFWMC